MIVSTSRPSEKISSFSRGIAAHLLPPGDDLLAAFDRRRAVRTEAGPVGDPVRGMAQEGRRAEGIRQHDQQIAAIELVPVLQNLVGRVGQLLDRCCASAATTIGSSCALVPSGFEIGIHGEQHVAGAGEGRADAFLQRLDAPALPQEAMAAARAEIGNAQVRQCASAARPWPTSWPWRGHRARRARNGPSSFIAVRERNSLMMASAGISHMVVSVHVPGKSARTGHRLRDSSYSGSWKSASQARKSGSKICLRP